MQGPYGVPPGGYGPSPAYGPAQPAYGAPQPYGAGQVPGVPMMPGQGYGPSAVIQSPKNAGIAVMLELLGGSFLQTFGIGHIYAGNVGVGLAWMFGYWAVTAINVFLCFILVGFVTWPLCWLAAMIISSITASNAAKRANAQMGLAGYG
jgi:hypothetical protein